MRGLSQSLVNIFRRNVNRQGEAGCTVWYSNTDGYVDECILRHFLFLLRGDGLQRACKA